MTTEATPMKSYIARTTDRIDLAAVAPLPLPLTIYIEPTNICNFGKQCFFCAQHLDDYKQQAGYSQNIALSTVEKLVSDIRALGGVKSIKLHFMGEGTIHPDLGEIARLAVSVCPDVVLTTNGSRLFADKARQLVDAGLHYVRFSIYEESNPKQQESILNNIATLKRLRDEAGSNHPFIVVKWLSQNPAFGDWIKETYAGIADELLFEGLRNFASAFIAADSLTPLTQRRHGSQIACAMPFYQMIVKANGDVACCCAAWDQSLNVGNILEQSLLEIWQGEKLAAIQRKHLEGKRSEFELCKTCDVIFSNSDDIDALTVEEFDRRRAEVVHG